MQNLDIEIKEEISAIISSEIEKRLNSEDDKKAQSEVLNLLTPKGTNKCIKQSENVSFSDNKALFVGQMVVLSLCLCIGVTASVLQVQMYRAAAKHPEKTRHKARSNTVRICYVY